VVERELGTDTTLEPRRRTMGKKLCRCCVIDCDDWIVIVKWTYNFFSGLGFSFLRDKGVTYIYNILTVSATNFISWT
jgi:hypothetical protein